MTDQLAHLTAAAERRTARAWYEDGLVELLTGGVLLFSALLNVVPDRLGLVGLALVLALAAASWRIASHLKRYLTDPHLGYVRPAPPARLRPRHLAAFALAVLLLQFVSTFTPGVALANADRVASFFPILFLSGVLFLAAWRTRLARFAALALVPPAVALAVGPLDYRNQDGMLVLSLVLGAAFLASGASALRRVLVRPASSARD